MPDKDKQEKASELTPEEVERLKSMEGKLMTMLEKFQEREKKLSEYVVKCIK